MHGKLGWILLTLATAWGCTAATGSGATETDTTGGDSQLADSDAGSDAGSDADTSGDVTTVGWTLFSINQTGFCAPTDNCKSTWLVSPDGSFSATKQRKSSSGKLSAADFATVQAAISTPAFLEKMKSGFTCSPPPTDIGIHFGYALFGVSYDADVTGCALSGGADGPLVQGVKQVVMAY